MVDNLARAVDNSSSGIQIAPASVKWCSVSLSKVVERGKRLEASVYEVESEKSLEIIKANKYPKRLLISSNGFVRNAYYGNRLKRNYVPKHYENAVGFIGSSEMLDIKPMPVKFMVKSEDTSSLSVKEGTILVSRSGTIGNVTYVGKTLSKLLISEHAIRLECNEYAGYIYAYLKSQIGQSIIKSKVFGSVIQEIEPEHLADIPVPDAPIKVKEKIHTLIARSYELRDESNDLIDEATKLLIDELHLPDIAKFKNNTVPVETFGVKLSNMNGRIDASYHAPIVDAITAHLRKYAAEVTTVGDKRISKKIILAGRFKRIYVTEGYGRVFIGGKQISELDPTNKKYLSMVHHKDRIASQLELHENMTLITCSGTIGKVALVGKHWENWAANQHIIRVIPSSESIAGYLYVFLASEYGHQLITRFTYGSVVDEIDDTHVSQIAVPLLKNKEIQSQINALALAANEKRYEAYKLEQQALTIMDEKVIFAK